MKLPKVHAQGEGVHADQNLKKSSYFKNYFILLYTRNEIALNYIELNLRFHSHWNCLKCATLPMYLYYAYQNEPHVDILGG